LSSAKKKRGKERSEKKEMKRKEVRGDPHVKGYGSQIFKSRSKSTVKRFWSETWRNYRKL
jgi:hypothetical protein